MSLYEVGDIVTTSMSRLPIVVLEIGPDWCRAYALRAGSDWQVGKEFNPSVNASTALKKFEGPLTDEEQALAMKWLLLGGPNK